MIGQLPFLHPYMFGNRTLIRFLKWVNPAFPDPLGTLFEVRNIRQTLLFKSANNLIHAKRIEYEMQLYDKDEKGKDRKDFLAQLRSKDDPSRPGYNRDMKNHLSNNM